MLEVNVARKMLTWNPILEGCAYFVKRWTEILHSWSVYRPLSWIPLWEPVLVNLAISIIFLSSLQKINTYPSDIPKIKGCSRCIWNSHSQTHTKVYQSKTVDLTPGLGDFILFEDYFTVEIIMIHSDQCPVDRATCEVWSHISSVITTTLINHPDP